MGRPELEELEFLAGMTDSADEFNDYYEKLLDECRANNDRVTVLSMQRLLFKQFLFLFGEWRREKGMVTAKDETSEKAK